MDMQVWLCDSEERKELKDEREREKRREIVIKILVSSHAPCSCNKASSSFFP